MYRKEVNEQSPVRILEASTHGGLGKSNLGVVMARAGVGKTACLVQIALDDLMREKRVLHIALGGQTVDHVQSWYDALFEDLANITGLEDRGAIRSNLAGDRLIQTHGSRILSAEQVDRTVSLLSENLDFHPATIIVDGFDWGGSVAKTAASLGALRAAAERFQAELWVSARTHRDQTGHNPTEVPQPCHKYLDLIDVAVYLEPESNHVSIQLLKDHDHTDVSRSTKLELQCDTMRMVVAGKDSTVSRLPARTCKLLSGAATGAEAEFGACAEKWGLTEIHFSFEGRPVARERGVVLLTKAELQRGNVSESYLKAHMHRTYPSTPLFRKVLQSIWHQVNTAGQVFVVGLILPDGTVKGGTGWAAELAKHMEKPLFVFDQERRGWYTWTNGTWAETTAPVIGTRRFTGTGSRFVSDEGKEAIRGLFERSFGHTK